MSAACLLPYLNKAFTIDDPFFLLEAQQVHKTPLHPTALSICWVYDTACGPIAHSMFLMAYVLAPVVNSSAPERLAHLIQIITLWCGIAATVSLAFRFGFSTFGACAAGLLVAATPPVLAMASTAMPDVLAMSLGVIGIERLMAWKDEGKFSQCAVSALALGLAPIARVHLGFLWPVGALLLRDDARIFDVRSWIALPKRRWIPLLAAISVMVAVLVITRVPGDAAKPTAFYLSLYHAPRNLRSYCIDWILALPLGIPWLALRNRRMKFLVLLPLFLVGTGLPMIWAMGSRSLHEVWTVLCAELGAFVLIDVLLWSFQSRICWRIACAFWLLIPLVTLPYIQLPVKFLVMCAPAVALLVADQLSALQWRHVMLCVIVGAGTVFGSMVLRADAQFAEMGRMAVARLVAPQVAAGQRVWLSSQWGLYWYAVKAGAQVLKPDDLPAPGDYLFRGYMEGYPGTFRRLPPAVPVDGLIFGGPGGRTMSRDGGGAGLYDNGRGDLLWVWGDGEWNHYELWQFR